MAVRDSLTENGITIANDKDNYLPKPTKARIMAERESLTANGDTRANSSDIHTRI